MSDEKATMQRWGPILHKYLRGVDLDTTTPRMAEEEFRKLSGEADLDTKLFRRVMMMWINREAKKEVPGAS